MSRVLCGAYASAVRFGNGHGRMLAVRIAVISAFLAIWANPAVGITARRGASAYPLDHCILMLRLADGWPRLTCGIAAVHGLGCVVALGLMG